MTRFRLPRIESSDAARALRLHAEVADRVEARRTTRTRSTRAKPAGERTTDHGQTEETP